MSRSKPPSSRFKGACSGISLDATYSVRLLKPTCGWVKARASNRMWLNSIPLAFSNSSSFWQQKEKQRQQQEPLFIQLYYAAAISTAAAEHNRARRNTKKRAETFQPLTQKNPNKKINKQTKKKTKKWVSVCSQSLISFLWSLFCPPLVQETLGRTHSQEIAQKLLHFYKETKQEH